MDCQLKSWNIDHETAESEIQTLIESCELSDEISKRYATTFKSNEKMDYMRQPQYKPFYNAICGSYLLNMSKPSFSLVEKYVYDIAMFHLNNMGIPMRPDIHVQFWLKTGKICKLTQLHRDWYTDYDEYPGQKKAFLSTITYFNDNDMPTLITDVKIKDRAEEKFDKFKKVGFSFPRKLKHISFLGRDYFHGHYKVFPETEYSRERYLLVVKLWDGKKPPVRVFNNELFLLENSYSPNETLVRFRSNIEATQIRLEHAQYICPRFFADVMISAKEDACLPFGNEIIKKGYPESDIFIIENDWSFYGWSFYLLFIFCVVLIIVGGIPDSLSGVLRRKVEATS
jgi:hypothetical protein